MKEAFQSKFIEGSGDSVKLECMGPACMGLQSAPVLCCHGKCDSSVANSHALFFNLQLIYLFLAVLGPCCCLGFPLTVVSGTTLQLWYVVVTSLAAEHGQGARASIVMVHGLSSCSSQALEHKLSSCFVQALLLLGMWDLPKSRIKPVSPALTGKFITTEPPNKPPKIPMLFLKKEFEVL